MRFAYRGTSSLWRYIEMILFIKPSKRGLPFLNELPGSNSCGTVAGHVNPRLARACLGCFSGLPFLELPLWMAGRIVFLIAENAGSTRLARHAQPRLRQLLERPSSPNILVLIS